MSHRRHRRSRAASHSVRPARLAAGALAGLLVLGWVYRPSLAGPNAGLTFLAGPSRGYGPPANQGRKAGGVGVAAAAGGVALVGAAAAGLLGGGAGAAGAAAAGGVFAAGAAAEAVERLKPLPEGANVTAVRMFPQQSILEPGLCRAMSLEGRSGKDGKWYSLTYRDPATFEMEGGEGCLMKQEGSRNIFCLPITASQTCNGRSVVITATYPGGPDGKPFTTTARIQLRVPGTGNLRLLPGGGPLTP